MSARALVLLAVLLVMFGGCATKNEAYTEAKQLLAEGKIDTGLASLEEAARKEPDNLEIRAMLARQREAIAARHLLDADSARSAGTSCCRRARLSSRAGDKPGQRACPGRLGRQ